MVVLRSSTTLVPGNVYTRAELKALFGIRAASINNGIFHPQGFNSIWIFVTKEKTSDRTQYVDSLVGDLLRMQGQISGRTDALIVEHRARDLELLVFHRRDKFEFPGAGFRYEGLFEFASASGGTPTSFVLQRAPGQLASASNPAVGTQKWHRAIHALDALGGSATLQEVRDYLSRVDHSYEQSDLATDFNMLSVNSTSRTAHPTYAGESRRSNSGNPYDLLFKKGKGRDAVYERYDAAAHGVWEIVWSAAEQKLVVRDATSTDFELPLQSASVAAELGGAFEPTSTEDARQRVLATIVRRRGQPAFRKALLQAYGGRCAISGCTFDAVLEAAHILPYRGEHTNIVQNGILLRADLHTLFDLGLLTIDASTYCVRLSPRLADSEYVAFEGTRILLPVDVCDHPTKDALETHALRWV